MTEEFAVGQYVEFIPAESDRAMVVEGLMRGDQNAEVSFWVMGRRLTLIAELHGDELKWKITEVLALQ